VSILTVVDFPAPFGPKKAQMAPGATWKERPSTAVNSPKRRVRLRHVIIPSIVPIAKLGSITG